MKRLGTALIAAAFAALSIVMLPVPAGACSCALGDPRDAVDASEAAFVGTLVERTEPQPENGVISSAQNVTWTFDVETVVKGPIGSTVDVHSPWDGASCGLEVGEGRRTGLLLYGEEGRWKSSLCLQMQPEVLLRAAEPLPAPNAPGPPMFFLGGTFGQARIVGLDAAGRTAAYGYGDGYALTVAGCPRGRHVAEIAIEEGDGGVETPTLVVRDAASLDPVREVRLPRDAVRVRELACRDAAATRLDLYVGDGGRAEILSVRGEDVASIALRDGRAATFRGDTAYVTERVRAGEWRVTRLDLTTGERDALAAVPPGTGPLVPSPDGTRLAGVVYRSPSGRNPPPSRVILVELRAEQPAIVERDLSRSNVTGNVVWLRRGRLAFFPDGDGDSDMVRVYDRELREIDRIDGWEADDVIVRGGRAYGLGWGTVQTLDLHEGSVEVLRRIDGEFFAFAHVPPTSLGARPDAGPTGRTGWLVAAVLSMTFATIVLAARVLRSRRS